MGIDPSTEHLETPSTGIFARHCGFVMIDGAMADNLLRLHRGAAIILAAWPRDIHTQVYTEYIQIQINPNRDYYTQ